ncbi:sugar phosphate nucleotidyltransferase [Paenibacillus beijingensis]|uniref:Mannose-1-phosphate guanylyltransferase n=1 Tax=Paenibacillus beijingensis TaxID=1126833 RepID=A0A0D5NGR7_9BACL|nr:sugar phosphate nucleotidyltransferase [Paenibacillus beijingensis]AJY74599.1 mannose-1-phosphate guanylyltransferase [Paenibacillus beijingensis]
MKIILLSGGSGKRLWPLSNDSRSKQFLKILKSDSGNYESMVQRVLRQLKQNGLAKDSYVTTSKGQYETIQSQLGNDISIIVEPETRDTFPAIALSALFLYEKEQVSLDETVIVMPVDPYVESEFFSKVSELEHILDLSKAELALIGVKPVLPSEKYGYIVPLRSCSEENYSLVDRFVEKPSERVASELISQGALWNCGVFAFRLEYIINALDRLDLPLKYGHLKNHYSDLPKISFDYQVVEKAEKIVVTEFDGNWKDLGTWNTLTEEMDTQKIGNVILSEECTNTHVINELDIPIAVIGVSNMVVAASPDGLLVTDKEASPRIKEVMKNHYSRPMYEERRWGHYKILDYSKQLNGKEILTKKIQIKEGMNLSYHSHQNRNEVWTVTCGKGVLVVDGVSSFVEEDFFIQIPAGKKHSIKALTDLEIIEIQSGSELTENDIERDLYLWEEIEKHCFLSSKKP